MCFKKVIFLTGSILLYFNLHGTKITEDMVYKFLDKNCFYLTKLIKFEKGSYSPIIPDKLVTKLIIYMNHKKFFCDDIGRSSSIYDMVKIANETERVDLRLREKKRLLALCRILDPNRKALDCLSFGRWSKARKKKIKRSIEIE